jgi:tight adherence protein B
MAGEARDSAILLAAMPVVTFAGLMLAAPSYAHVLIDDPMGRHLLGTAVAMVMVGGAIMYYMIRNLLR